MLCESFFRRKIPAIISAKLKIYKIKIFAVSDNIGNTKVANKIKLIKINTEAKIPIKDLPMSNSKLLKFLVEFFLTPLSMLVPVVEVTGE